MNIDKATVEEYNNAPMTISLFTKSSLPKVNGNNDYFHAKIGDSKRFVCYKVVGVETNTDGAVVGVSLRKVKATESVVGTAVVTAPSLTPEQRSDLLEELGDIEESITDSHMRIQEIMDLLG